MIGRARESRNPKKVIRVTLMESYGEIGRMPVNLCFIISLPPHGDPAERFLCRRTALSYGIKDAAKGI